MVAITSPTERSFLEDVRGHELIILRDDGVHRHLRFRRPESGTYWFDLITWPGTLCIDGDMGTYVFRRLEDMFEFFRADRQYQIKDGRTLFINPGYWGEKLASISKNGGLEEFSPEKFRSNVKEYFDNWKDSSDACPKEFEKLWNEIEGDVLFDCENEYESYAAAHSFAYPSLDFSFSDFWEFNCKDYTYHFIWACYAVAWGVNLYDNATTKLTESA